MPCCPWGFRILLCNTEISIAFVFGQSSRVGNAAGWRFGVSDYNFEIISFFKMLFGWYCLGIFAERSRNIKIYPKAAIVNSILKRGQPQIYFFHVLRIPDDIVSFSNQPFFSPIRRNEF